MKSMAYTLHYGKTVIDYDLLIMNRKSLEIAVHPDKSVVVKAPRSSSIEAIQEKIKKRVRWIKKQIVYFTQFEPKTPARKYVGGESHLYLGRQYRLKIEQSARDNVLLKNGYFCIECCQNDKPMYIQGLLEAWYRQRARIYLLKVFDDCWESFNKLGMDRPILKLKSMEKRWGSLSSKKNLTLNFRLIQVPKQCIEYVVIHELCHLIHHNHGPDFYALLERTMPDWMKRKEKLESTLV